MGSALNDVGRAKKWRLPMAEEGDRSGDRDDDGESRAIVIPPAAEEDVSSSTDVSTLDQSSSGCSCSVDMAPAGPKSEGEEEPEDVQVETSSMRRCNSRGEETAPFGEEEVIEGDDVVELDRSRTVPRRRRPAEAELEEFFAGAERQYQEQKKRLVEKYNFDFDLEEPLEVGRYEWLRLSPMKKKKKIKN